MNVIARLLPVVFIKFQPEGTLLNRDRSQLGRVHANLRENNLRIKENNDQKLRHIKYINIPSKIFLLPNIIFQY